MTNINDDILKLPKIMNGTLDGDWNSIYSRNTEDLNRIASHIDFRNKEIYSVLSSSDILFYLYLNGAKKVDTFDINSLTYRYYFLRKWLLESNFLDAENLGIKEIDSIIKSHRNANDINERESCLLWQYYLDLKQKEKFYEESSFRFYNDALFENCYMKFDFPYSEEEIKKLVDKLNSNKLDFEVIDILSDSYNNSQKYDIVYLSNILDLKTANYVENAMNNMNKLLKDNGIVVCTNMVNHPYFDLFSEQTNIFSKYFEYEILDIELRGIAKNRVKYYKYTKKANP